LCYGKEVTCEEQAKKEKEEEKRFDIFIMKPVRILKMLRRRLLLSCVGL
jgi:hypothetical protein